MFLTFFKNDERKLQPPPKKSKALKSKMKQKMKKKIQNMTNTSDEEIKEIPQKPVQEEDDEKLPFDTSNIEKMVMEMLNGPEKSENVTKTEMNETEKKQNEIQPAETISYPETHVEDRAGKYSGMFIILLTRNIILSVSF